jgi:hypothetical protein
LWVFPELLELTDLMDDKIKFVLALMQIENISELMKENEYEQFMVSHLMTLKVEIQRQLSNLK